MKNKTLTLGSLFDGSGGFPLGGLLAGITPVWASEIEPFPIRVTTKRLPFMKHYGNISAMDGGRIEPVDIITFGSPCQDMSVAGRRDGLDGARSSLFYEAVRIIKEMRCATDGNIQDGSVGRMFPAPSPRTRVRTSKPSSKRSSASQSRTPRCLCLKKHDGPTPTFIWETDGALRTDLLTHNTGEFPSEDAASTLSQILQAEVPEKYYLSQKACLGILRRASARGKELPEVLRLALERQASMDTTAV